MSKIIEFTDQYHNRVQAIKYKTRVAWRFNDPIIQRGIVIGIKEEPLWGVFIKLIRTNSYNKYKKGSTTWVHETYIRTNLPDINS